MSDNVWHDIIYGVVTLGLAWMAKRKLDMIHGDVNGNLSVSLQATAAALRTVATITKESKDKVAAEQAEKAYVDHQAQKPSNK